MQKIGLIALYEMRQVLTRRWLIGYFFIMPLVFIFILGSALSAFFEPGSFFEGPVVVAAAAEDEGPVEERLRAFLTEEEKSGHIVVHPVDSREEMNRQLADGSADAGIYVPAGFSDTALRGEPVFCDIVLGGSSEKSFVGQTILSRFVDDLNDTLAAAKVLGSDVSEALKAAPIHPEVQDGVRMGKLSPANKHYTAFQYYGVSMLVMFMLYSGLMAAMSLVEAKENHTLLRLHSMPIHPSHLMAGKLAGLFATAFLQAMMVIVGTRFLYGLDWGGETGLLILICLLVITCSMSFAVLVGLFAGTSKEVHRVFQSMIIGMTFLSGGFMPDIGGFVSVLGQFTVNHWAVQGILHMMLGSEWTIVVRHISILGLITIALAGAALLTFRKVGYR